MSNEVKIKENLNNLLQDEIKYLDEDVVYEGYGNEEENKEKAYKLLEFVEKENRLPLSTEKYNYFKIGSFWRSIKQGNYKNVYNNILSKNSLIKEEIRKFLEKKDDRNKKEKLSPEEKAYKLIEFIEKEKRLPVSTEEYYNFKIGSFWSTIKQGRNKNIYHNILSKNIMINKSIDKFLEEKEKKEGKEKKEIELGEKEKLSTEQKALILIEFVEKEKRLPSSIEEYHQLKIGVFWNLVKQGNNKNVYHNILSKNILIKEEMDKFLEKKEKKIKLSAEEKAHILIEFIEEQKRFPKSKEEYNNFKIGSFWKLINQGKNKKIYDNILSKNILIKETVDAYLKENKKEDNKGNNL